MLANQETVKLPELQLVYKSKNSLTSKDPDIKAQYQQRWLAIDANARQGSPRIM